MTLNNIIEAALDQLDRGHDSQNMKEWSNKFTRFVNDAVLDLSETLKQRRCDVVDVEAGIIDTTKLPRGCRKVLSVRQDGKELPFLLGPDSTKVKVDAVGPVEVEYRFVPKTISSTSDVPELPAWVHGLIVHYVVGRERATADPSVQRGSNIYFELYNEGKKQIRRNLGEQDSYQIKNRW